MDTDVTEITNFLTKCVYVILNVCVLNEWSFLSLLFLQTFSSKVRRIKLISFCLSIWWSFSFSLCSSTSIVLMLTLSMILCCPSVSGKVSDLQRLNYGGVFRRVNHSAVELTPPQWNDMILDRNYRNYNIELECKIIWLTIYFTLLVNCYKYVVFSLICFVH